MTDPNFTAICVLLDRSGSMDRIREDAEGGLKNFIEEQRKIPGTCTLRLDQFDDVFENVFPSTSIDDVPFPQLIPRNRTALLDSWGRSMAEFGEELAKLNESDRPGKVYFVVITDGLENASREWTKPQINSRVTEQKEKWGWEFIYLGANQDAVQEGADYGLLRGQTMSYAHSHGGTQAVYAGLSQAVSRSRVSGQSIDFTEEERAASEEKDKS